MYFVYEVLLENEPRFVAAFAEFDVAAKFSQSMSLSVQAAEFVVFSDPKKVIEITVRAGRVTVPTASAAN